jgi:DNA polymerase III delta prime subunit
MAIRDIAGNKKAKQMMLSNAGGMKYGTAFMITGEENTGKTFAAMQFAKAMNCLKPGPDNDCCDECGNCRLIDKVLGSLDENGFQQYPHPDVFFITTEKAQLSIELLRTSLGEAGAYRALNLRKKIVIVADAERMNNAAANSILKQLEEPNPSLAIILVVNNPEKLLPTIRSRCQAIEMKRAPLAEIEARLVKTGLAGKELKDALLFCEGRIGEAFNYKKIKENIAVASGLFKAIASGNDDVEGIFDALDFIDEKRKEKKKAKQKDEDGDTDSTGPRLFLQDILRILARMYKDLMLERLGVKAVFGEKYGMASGVFRNYTERNIMNILKMIEAAQRDLMMNANISVLFAALFFNIRKEGLTS